MEIYICVRTTARIRQDADKEHEKQDPKPRWQTNLCMLVYRFSCLCGCLYIDLRVSMRERINAWVTDPRAQPLNSDLVQS